MIGIDPAGRTIAVVDTTAMWSKKLTVPKTDRGRELQALANQLYEMPLRGAVWVESPVLAGARNVQSTVQIAQTTGVIHATVDNTHQVAPSAWKARTIGKGNADKAAVRAWLDSHHPALAALCHGDQDLYDAACIALYGDSVAQAMAASGLGAPYRGAAPE